MNPNEPDTSNNTVSVIEETIYIPSVTQTTSSSSKKSSKKIITDDEIPKGQGQKEQYDDEKSLKLMMLGCEVSNIYGPNENIAVSSYFNMRCLFYHPLLSFSL